MSGDSTDAASTGSQPPTPNPEAMARAIEVARRGAGSVSPNPPVGAVAVRDGEILGEGWHGSFGGPHAERDLIERLIASRGADACRGADLYVTLEPCAHHGKTPPCSDAVIAQDFARVFVGCDDPNPLTTGRSYAQFAAAGISVVRGVEESSARALIAGYLCRHHASRALVTAKWAMTADGRIATATGDARWISADETRAETRRERSTYDAILVGIGTVRADNPDLTARTEGVGNPARVVLDSTLSIDLQTRLVASAAETPLLVLGSAAHATDANFEERRRALEAVSVEVAVLPAVGGHVPPLTILEELARRGHATVLVEGGGRVHGAFLAAGLIDRVQIIVAPKLCGGESAPGPVGGRGLGRMAEAPTIVDPIWRQVGQDMILEGSVTPAGRGEWPRSASG